jgi:hypothetical protein
LSVGDDVREYGFAYLAAVSHNHAMWRVGCVRPPD